MPCIFSLFYQTNYSFRPKPACVAACSIVYGCQLSQIPLNLDRILWLNIFSGWLCIIVDVFASACESLVPFRNWILKKNFCWSFPLCLMHVFLYFSQCMPYLKSELDCTFQCMKPWKCTDVTKKATYFCMTKWFHLKSFSYPMLKHHKKMSD